MGTPPFRSDTLRWCSAGCGAVERLLSEGRGGERGNSPRAAVVQVVVGGGEGAELCPRCGKTSSFVYGEVIGTLSLLGQPTQASHFLSLSFSQSDCGSSDTSWPPPPLLLTPVASSLSLSLCLSFSHDFLFPVRLPASPTHRRP